MPKIAADLTYLDGRFERDVAIEFDEMTGRIRRVQRGARAVSDARRLENRALLPGFINAHSHAFQRLIRGRTQWRPATSQPSDFWSWRESMYSALLGLSPEDVFAVSRFCFLEMLKAGFTTVGEFHYLQRDPGGKSYDDPLELHNAVLAAAADVGIRIVMINTAYAMGGVQQPLRPKQRRFNTPRLDEFLATCDTLRSRVAGLERASMGIAPHSVRAVPRDWLTPIGEWAAAATVPLHMHVSEQIAEVEACESVYRKRPVELLDDAGLLTKRFTAVHATHISMHEIALLARARATVCACPTTERDLGDGFLPASSLYAAGVRFAIGTDSQSVIAPLEEMRLIEYHERLRRNERVLLGHVDAGTATVGPTLLATGTVQGAKSLSVDAGAIADGLCADFVAIDLDNIQLAGWTADTLDALLALSADTAVVTDVWVGGQQVVAAGTHARQELATSDFLRVAAQ